MTIATTSNLTMTREAFLRMPGNEHYEWMHGQAIAMAENPIDHAVIIGTLTMRLSAFVRQHRLGVTCTESAHYQVTLADGTTAIRQADVSFIAGDAKAIRKVSPHPGGPDLAVEVTSEWDKPAIVEAKIEMWLNNRTPCVWQVGHDQRLTIHLPDRKPIVLGPDDTLKGEPVLPGFAVPVSEFYQ